MIMGEPTSERALEPEAFSPDTECICAQDHQTLLAIPQMYESDSTDNSTSNEISQHWQVEEAGVERVGRRCTPATHCLTVKELKG